MFVCQWWTWHLFNMNVLEQCASAIVCLNFKFGLFCVSHALGSGSDAVDIYRVAPPETPRLLAPLLPGIQLGAVPPPSLPLSLLLRHRFVLRAAIYRSCLRHRMGSKLPFIIFISSQCVHAAICLPPITVIAGRVYVQLHHGQRLTPHQLAVLTRADTRLPFHRRHNAQPLQHTLCHPPTPAPLPQEFQPAFAPSPPCPRPLSHPSLPSPWPVNLHVQFPPSRSRSARRTGFHVLLLAPRRPVVACAAREWCVG